MTLYKTIRLAKYIVEELIQNNLVRLVIFSDDYISELKQRLTTEVEARLCVMPEGLTFETLVEATVSQININKYIKF